MEHHSGSNRSVYIDLIEHMGLEQQAKGMFWSTVAGATGGGATGGAAKGWSNRRRWCWSSSSWLEHQVKVVLVEHQVKVVLLEYQMAGSTEEGGAGGAPSGWSNR